MNLVFVSNYFNHHQQPVSQKLYQLCTQAGGSYFFIQTERMEEERVVMGWGNALGSVDFVRNYWENPQDYQRMIDEADAVIFGGTDKESYVRTRLKEKKPLWRYSERLYKEGRYRFITPRGLRRKFLDHTRHNGERVYLLCSGAYVAGDFRMVAAYPFKKFRYGYFPEHKVYDADALMEGKYAQTETEVRRSGEESLRGADGSVQFGAETLRGAVADRSMPVKLLWAARMIDWKHPERAVLMTEALLHAGFDVHLTMVGSGPEEGRVRELVARKGLQQKVTLTGFQDPAAVRSLMEKSQVYLATSDRKEGWGAVINEAMNSGCVVAADRAMGAAPYLIRDEENGILYPTGKISAAVRRLAELLREPGYAGLKQMGKAAYRTIDEVWNAETAARRLYACIEAELRGAKLPEYESGPMSRI
ncbi:MAG: glycosyltransferase family 4 protein [Lachnospiraceae bacterium]|nr:glycosyltransferase family 4 protein [Lachnospiraceae bacterium]